MKKNIGEYKSNKNAKITKERTKEEKTEKNQIY